MIHSSRLQWIGLLLLVMMAVRVSITPGIQHRHKHGDIAHTHHHGHHAGHHHSHSHDSHSDGAGEPQTSHSHIHVSILGWKITLSTPWADEALAESPTEADASRSKQETEQAELLPDELCLQSATSWGTFLQWVFDIKSPAPPGKQAMPQGTLAASRDGFEPGFSSRDREPPPLPPPEDSLLQIVIG